MMRVKTMKIDKQTNHTSLKVLYLARGYWEEMAEMMEAMANYNEVHFVCVKADEQVLQHISGRVHAFKSGAPRVPSFRNLFYMCRLAMFVRRLNPDIIHIQSELFWELLFIIFPTQKPVVLTRHDVLPHPSEHTRSAIERWASKKELEMASAIMVHSDSLVKLCYEAHGARIGNKMVRSIPIGVRNYYGQSNGLENPPCKQLLFFGRCDKYKGLEVLAQAWATVRMSLPDARMVIAGSTKTPDYHRSLFARFPEVDCRLTFQSASEVVTLFSESTAMVLPYIEASQSGVLMQAHAFALPTVISSVGGLADVAKDEFNCLSVVPGDAVGLAKAIVRILSDNKLRGTLRANIIQERETVYAWNTIAQSLDSLYREVLAGRR